MDTWTAEQAVKTLLKEMGEDPERKGLLETPARYVKAFANDWCRGYKDPPDAEILKCFEDGADGCDEMVVQRDIPIWSLCEHHMAPFFGVAHVAYIPSGRIVGLSKLSRIVDKYARRLQVQERITNQVANALHDTLQPLGVGVVLECRHTCMESRGIKKAGTVTLTCAVRGALKEKPEARAEFFELLRRR